VNSLRPTLASLLNAPARYRIVLPATYNARTAKRARNNSSPAQAFATYSLSHPFRPRNMSIKLGALPHSLSSDERARKLFARNVLRLKALGVDVDDDDFELYLFGNGKVVIVFDSPMEPAFQKIMGKDDYGSLHQVVRALMRSMVVGTLMGTGANTLLGHNQWPNKNSPLYTTATEALVTIVAASCEKRSYGAHEELLAKLDKDGKEADKDTTTMLAKRGRELAGMAVSAKDMGEGLEHLGQKMRPAPKCGGCNKSTCQYFSVTIRRCCG